MPQIITSCKESGLHYWPNPSAETCRGFFQTFRQGVGGQRGLAHHRFKPFFCPLFSYAFVWVGEHNSRGHLLLYCGRRWSPTPSRQPLFEASDLCFNFWRILPGDLPGGFFWALFHTKMKPTNSGSPMRKIRRKSLLPKTDPNTTVINIRTETITNENLGICSAFTFAMGRYINSPDFLAYFLS